ncbi:MAG: heme A synthase [bacterium]|nr:MAG: heme A synthase [bacterium]
MKKNEELNRIHKQIAVWLVVCCITIFTIVLLGGATRLTGSGLSIPVMKVFKGVIPPLNQEEWKQAFHEYKATPEYKKTYMSGGMDMKAYKSIFWLEYFHRLVGRFLAGIIFFIPFIYFLIRYFFVHRVIAPSLIYKLILMFVLGGLQGLLGWIMVKSGMNSEIAYIQGHEVHVSPYRLTAHLALAFLIYAYIVRVILSIWPTKSQAVTDSSTGWLKPFSWTLIGLLFLLILSGGFVAGTQGGLVYQSFPLMNGFIIPPDYFLLEPWYRNLFENRSAVQFDHRVLAYLVFLVTLVFWIIALRKPITGRIKVLTHSVFLTVILQVVLGVITLLTFVDKDTTTIFLATAHQANALILFTLFLWLNYEIKSD